MTDSNYIFHTFQPPKELVDEWLEKLFTSRQLISVAAQWGADQELEAILNLVSNGQHALPEKDRYLDGLTVSWIRNARRPGPSLKEQAIALLQPGEPRFLNREQQDVIRRALEALPR